MSSTKPVVQTLQINIAANKLYKLCLKFSLFGVSACLVREKLFVFQVGTNGAMGFCLKNVSKSWGIVNLYVFAVANQSLLLSECLTHAILCSALRARKLHPRSREQQMSSHPRRVREPHLSCMSVSRFSAHL